MASDEGMVYSNIQFMNHALGSLRILTVALIKQNSDVQLERRTPPSPHTRYTSIQGHENTNTDSVANNRTLSRKRCSSPLVCQYFFGRIPDERFGEQTQVYM
jgi:hypothetical protein